MTVSGLAAATALSASQSDAAYFDDSANKQAFVAKPEIEAAKPAAIERGKALSADVHHELEDKLHDLTNDLDKDDPDEIQDWKNEFNKEVLPWLKEHAKDGPIALGVLLGRYDGSGIGAWGTDNVGTEYRDIVLDPNAKDVAQDVYEQISAGDDRNNTAIYGLNEGDADAFRKNPDWFNNAASHHWDITTTSYGVYAAVSHMKHYLETGKHPYEGHEDSTHYLGNTGGGE